MFVAYSRSLLEHLFSTSQMWGRRRREDSSHSHWELEKNALPSCQMHLPSVLCFTASLACQVITRAGWPLLLQPLCICLLPYVPGGEDSGVNKYSKRKQPWVHNTQTWNIFGKCKRSVFTIKGRGEKAERQWRTCCHQPALHFLWRKFQVQRSPNPEERAIKCAKKHCFSLAKNPI